MFVLRQRTAADVYDDPRHHDAFRVNDTFPAELRPPGVIPELERRYPDIPKKWLVGFAPNVSIVRAVSYITALRIDVLPVGKILSVLVRYK